MTNQYEGYTSEAGAVIDALADQRLIATEQIVGPGEEVLGLNIFTANGVMRTAVDFERYLTHPRRAQGTVKVLSADGFIAAFKTHAVYPAPNTDPSIDGDSGPLAVYLDEATSAMVAVLNDDNGDVAGWRDYRIELALRETPEWKAWKSLDGKMVTQGEFAEHIEEGLPEIVRPDSAAMLELAQTFTASVSARFKQQARLPNGQTQYVYEEEVDGKAGTAGDLSIPYDFELAVSPFIGSGVQPVTCRLRTRLNGGKLTLGYLINRANEVEARAFDDIASKVEDALPGVAFIEGVAPEARRTTNIG